jgi:hypothetical protein
MIDIWPMTPPVLSLSDRSALPSTHRTSITPHLLGSLIRCAVEVQGPLPVAGQIAVLRLAHTPGGLVKGDLYQNMVRIRVLDVQPPGGQP